MSASHVLLTGPPGVGKSTVIKKVCEELRKKKNFKVDGFFTEEVRVSGERIGFDIVTLSGQRGVLARVGDANARRMPKVGKYAVDVPSFEKLALPVFECSDLDVLVLDEIGKMELFSKPFLSKAREAFSTSKSRILATIPIPKGPLPLVDDLRTQENCSLIQVSKQNRDELPTEIVQQLLES